MQNLQRHFSPAQTPITLTVLLLWVINVLLSDIAAANASTSDHEATTTTLSSWQTSLPRIQTLIPNTQHLEVLGKHHTVVVHGLPKNYASVDSDVYSLPNKDIQLTYAFTVIQASANTVKKTLMDFARYRQTMPHIIESKLLQQENNHWLAQYRLTFQMPLLSFEPQVTIQHSLLPNGDLIERRITGDIDYSVARWQIIPLDKQRTLLLQISWADIGSISWLMRLVFAAQPEMHRLSPLAAAALTLQSLKKRIEQKTFTLNQLRYTAKPSFPNNTHFLTTLTEKQQNALRPLTSLGSVSMISPIVYYSYQQRSFSLQPILSAVSVPQAFEKLKSRSTRVADYPKYMQAISDISNVSDDKTNHRSQWSLGFNFAIFTFDIDFGIEGLWNSDQSQFSFASTQGDFDPLLGKINWYQSRNYTNSNNTNSNNTLVTQSLAHNISDDAGYILSTIKQIPYSQMFAGLYVGTLLIEGQQQLAYNLR